MIGEALRLIRVFHDTKLTDMAKALDVSPSYLSEIEHGKRNANLDVIQKYAEHFKIRTSAVLFFAEEIDKKSIKGKGKALLRDNMIKLMRAIEKFGSEGSDQIEM